MSEPNLILITVASILGASGIGLAFVGVLVVALVALGNKHYVWGALSVVFFPIAMLYCGLHRSTAAYGAKLLFPGVLLFVVFWVLMWWELSRLGLDIMDVMASTRPKH